MFRAEQEIAQIDLLLRFNLLIANFLDDDAKSEKMKIGQWGYANYFNYGIQGSEVGSFGWNCDPEPVAYFEFFFGFQQHAGTT